MDFYLEPDKAIPEVLSAPYKLSFGKQLSQEISLPDFYEDLARIIDCSAKAVVTETELSDGVLSVSGEVSYSILYYSDKDSILHRFLFEQEFEAKWDADEESKLLDIILSCREPSVRIYGTRKLSVSMDCDFTVFLCKAGNLKMPDTQNAELMQKTGETFTYERLESEKSRFSEDFIIPPEYPSLEEIVYWDLSKGAAVGQTRADGLLVSSDAQLFVIYTDENGEYVSYKTKLPLTALVREVSGDYVCADLFVYSPKCAAISDSNGENRRIALDFELSASALVLANKQFTYVADAYCTDCQSKLEVSELSLGRAEGTFDKQFTVKDLIANDGEIKELLAVRTNPELLKTRRDGEMLYGEGPCNCTVLAKTESGGMSAYEHAVTFDISLRLSENAENTVIKVETEKVNFESVKDGFEIEIEVKASVNAFSQSDVMYVTQITKGEREDKEEDCSMLIYYPDKDESLWEIGKKHRASTEKIVTVNKLDSEDIKNRKFILIPKR